MPCSHKMRSFRGEDRRWQPWRLRLRLCARDGNPGVTDGALAVSNAPVAGFSVIEAADVKEVIDRVSGTPCARAKGAIEIRPIIVINEEAWRDRP